jgi:uroporphyrin-3 C-methyltransferase
MQDNVIPPQATPASPSSDNRGERSATPFIIGLVAAIAFGWFAWDTRNTMNELRAELATKLADADDRSKQTFAAANQARQDTKEAPAKVSVLENKLAESQNQQVALETLYQELSKNRDSFACEIEDVLDLASQQLQLAGNVKSALIALQSIDAKLAHADSKARWTQLRKAINKDMERLKATPFVDTIAISVKLDNLMASVDNLPLLSDPVIAEDTQTSSPPIAQKSVWSRFGKEILGDLGELVRVRNLGKPDVPLLTPSQSYFLRENLKLRLLNARLALLARTEASFKTDLKSAEQWLATSFDPKMRAVISAQATLKQLAEALSASLFQISLTALAPFVRRGAREKGNR